MTSVEEQFSFPAKVGLDYAKTSSAYYNTALILHNAS